MPVESRYILSKGQQYSPVFADTTYPGGSIATVNAGNPDLVVGHGGINGNAFAPHIINAEKYKAFHEGLLRRADSTGFASVTGGTTDPVSESIAMVGKGVRNANGAPDGTVIIDVFRDFEHPKGVAANKAMVYIVPPNRLNYRDDQSFLQAVRDTSVNIVKTLQKYNENHLGDEITTLRTCAFSSDLFSKRQDGSQVDVTKITQQIMAGINDGIAGIAPSKLTIAAIEYEEGIEEVFSKADKLSRSSPTPPTPPIPPIPPEPEVIDYPRSSTETVQIAANLLRLGGDAGNHRLSKVDPNLIKSAETAEDVERMLVGSSLQGCFVTQKDGEFYVLEAGFQPPKKGSQEEAAYQKFIELGYTDAQYQQEWNQILGDSCRRVYAEMKKSIPDPNYLGFMRDAIATFQANQGNDYLAQNFNGIIRHYDIGILTKLEESHHSFQVPGADGLTVHQLYAPQCNGSDRALSYPTMRAVYHPEMAEIDPATGEVYAASTIAQSQKKSLKQAEQEGSVIHTTYTGSKVYATDKGFSESVIRGAEGAFRDVSGVQRVHCLDVADTIETIAKKKDSPASLFPADQSQYSQQDISSAKILDLVSSFLGVFKNKSSEKKRPENGVLYDANDKNNRGSLDYSPAQLPIKSVIRQPNNHLDIVVSEELYQIYNSLSNGQQNLFKRTLKDGIEGKKMTTEQKKFLEDLGTMQAMSARAEARSIMDPHDVVIGADTSHDAPDGMGGRSRGGRGGL